MQKYLEFKLGEKFCIFVLGCWLVNLFKAVQCEQLLKRPISSGYVTVERALRVNTELHTVKLKPDRESLIIKRDASILNFNDIFYRQFTYNFIVLFKSSLD